jgi:CspA family cold shock protein
MLKGTVKFFNEAKGFGFIVDNATGQDIFVHVSGLIDNIREGDVVTYDTARGKKGMNAVNVQRA